MTGEYRMTMDPSEKDALLYVPGAGLTLTEQMGLSSKTNRFNRTDGTHLGQAFGGESANMNQFNRLEQFAKLQKPPVVKFKDLEAAIRTRITYNVLPMRVRMDFIRMTNSSVLTNITLQFDNKDLQFQAKEGVQKAVVNVFGRITTMSRRPVNTFERTVSVDAPPQMLKEFAGRQSIFQESIPLTPGTYRLNVVAKDIVAGNMNNYEIAITVPHFDDEKLASSSMILADQLEKVPTKSIGAGQFVIGTSKVRPKLDESFKQDEKLGIYVQFYNFSADEKTKKPNASVDYEIVKKGTNEKILEFSEDVNTLPGASANQVTVEKVLSLKQMPPGQYTLKLKVTDKINNQTLTPSTSFTVM